MTNDTRKSRLIKRFALIPAAIVLIAIGLIVFKRVGDASSPKPSKTTSAATDTKQQELAVPVEVTFARRGTVSAAISGSSTIESEQSADILSKIEGIVTAVHVEEGTSVTRGQVLVELETEEKQVALDQAKAKLEAARREFERGERAYREQVMSQQDYDKLRNAYDIAKADIEKATLELTYTKIRAPFAGRIVERSVVAGRHVRPGDKLFALASFNPLLANVYVPEKDVYGLKLGQHAELVLEAQGDRKLDGRVLRISPVVDAKTGTVKVTIAVPPSDAATVRPGAFVRVNILTDSHPNALLVPKIAIVREDQHDFVYVVDGAVAARRKVSLGYANDGHIEIAAGLKGTESIVVAGQGSLKDGAKIEVVKKG